MSTLGVFKRDDIVREYGDIDCTIVLACGKVTYDLLSQSGFVVRYRHDADRDVRVANASDWSFDAKWEARVRKALAAEAARARAERRPGAASARGYSIKRSAVSPSGRRRT